MMLTAAYFDESTDESDAGYCYTVAGWLTALDDGAILCMKWKDLLNKYGMKYFKASEVEYCAGELRKFRERPGNGGPLTQKDKDFKNQVKTEFVDLICESPYLVGNSVTILLRDWKQFKLDEPELALQLPTVYNLAYQTVLMEVGLSIHDYNDSRSAKDKVLIRPVIDSHEQLEPQFMHAYPVWAEKNPRSSVFTLPPFYEDEQEYRCLQAADCLAYEVRRFVTGYINDSDTPKVRVAMERMGEKCNHMYLLDYETIRKLASVQPQPDVIPFPPRKTNRPTRQRKLCSH
jgi:Protein of unknown function (DUF3800)